MRFRDTISYKIKCLVPALGIVGATMLPTSCCKNNPENTIPHHNTTYIWGVHYWKEVWPADKVVASADSTVVDNVFLASDGVSWEGLPTTVVLGQLVPIIESVSPQNRYKIRGAGIINDVGIGSEQTRQDSITLANMGFKFGHVYHR